jgi:hypothetical protein
VVIELSFLPREQATVLREHDYACFAVSIRYRRNFVDNEANNSMAAARTVQIFLEARSLGLHGGA